jgi:DNA-binding transcriptional ArsR family regulator
LARTPAARARASAAGSAAIFAALGDETRLGLVSRLSTDGPQSIARLTTGFQMSRQAITKHLRVLEDVGLVHSTAQGRESQWALDQKRLAEARRFLQQISSEWDSTLGRLKAFVER